jgi:hypothetical protein
MDHLNDLQDVMFVLLIVVSFHDEAREGKEEDVEVISLVVSELD